MRDAAIAEAVWIALSTTLTMWRARDALVVGRDIHVELVEIDVLLIVGADQVVEVCPVMASTGWPSHFAS